MLRFRRPACALLLLLLTFWPSLVFGQATKAGVVTTLEGNVTVARGAVPRPVALKFKDDVFLQDRITTGDKSIARLLLGGAAVVTVRERSVLTITEVPGRSTVNLDSGKIGLAVAREKLRPGEVIEIRTANAVAGVRGTVVVAEVTRASAQLGGAVPAVVTTFYVLRGAIEALQLDPATQQVVTQAVTVGVRQAFTVAGSAAARLETFTPAREAEIRSGLQPQQGPQHKETQNQDQVVVQAVQTAVALVTTLLSTVGDGGTTQTTGGTTDTAGTTGTGGTTDIGGTTTTDTPITPISTGGAEQLIAETTVQISGFKFFPTGERLKTFTGVTTSTSSLPAVEITSATVTQEAGDNLIQVDPGASVALAGPLLDVTDSLVVAGSSVVDILGSLSSSSTAPLLSFDPTTVIAPGDFIRIDAGGSLALAGPLLSDVGGTLVAGDDFVEVLGALSSTSLAPLIQLNGSAVSVGGGFLTVGPGATVNLAGPLLAATSATLTVAGSAFLELAGASLTVGGPILDLTNTALDLGAVPVARLTGGSTLLNTAGPAIRLNGGSLTADALASTDGSGNVVTLTGTALDLTNATVTVRTLIDSPAGGGDLVQVLRALNEPAIRMSSSALTITGGTPVVTLGVEAGAPPAETGVVLVATGTTASPSTFTLTGPLLELLAIVSTATNPLVQLDHTTLTQTGVSDALVVVSPNTLTTTVAGPLLEVVDSTLTTQRSILLSTTGVLTSSTTDPFVSITGSVVTTGQNFLNIGHGFNLTLRGSLLQAVSSTLATAADQTLLALAAGGHLSTVLTTDPLLSMTGGMLTAGLHLIHVDGTGSLGAAPTSVDLAGPLLVANGGAAITAAGSIVKVEEGGLLTAASTDPLVSLTGGTHSIASLPGAVMFSLTGSATAVDPDTGLTLGTDEPLQHAGTLLNLSGATVTGQKVLRVDTALLEASLPILTLREGSTLTTSASAFDLVNGANLSSTGAELVRIDGSAFNVLSGSLVSLTGASKLTVTGNLLTLANGATLTIQNGVLLTVTQGSFATITGALVNFVGSGNTLNVTNGLVPNVFLNGIPIFKAGLTATVTVTNANPLAGLNTNGNTISINGTPLPTGATTASGSLIAVSGGGTVKVGP
ncbi:MAG: FecR domain-containing protein [Candidatus Rokubacteria bacterium]|nr:FecR domain-containing protein [Candidatus Rokubacteria bacterium]